MDKRSDILKAAQQLFAQFGLKKVTSGEIAKRARVSKATLYKYYRNKNDVFEAVVRFESEELWQHINQAVDREDTAVDKLRAHLLSKMSKLQELVNFYKVTSKNWEGYWPYIDKVREEFMTGEKKMVAKILVLGNKTKELQVEQIELTAHILVITLKSLEYPWVIEGYNISLPGFVDLVLRHLLEGIGKK